MIVRKGSSAAMSDKTMPVARTDKNRTTNRLKTTSYLTISMRPLAGHS